MAQLMRHYCHGERVDAVLGEKQVDTLKELMAAVRRDVDASMRHTKPTRRLMPAT